MKRNLNTILIILLCTWLGGPLVWAARPDSVPDSDWSVQALKDLAQKGFLKGPLPDKSSYSSREMALWVAQAVQSASNPAQSPAATAMDWDKIYKLVREYEEEMVNLGAKLDKIADQLVSLRQKQTQLEQNQEKFFAEQMPVYIGGDFWTGFDQMQMYGYALPVPYSGAPAVELTRDIRNYFDLDTVCRSPYGSAEIEMRALSYYHNSNDITQVDLSAMRANMETPYGQFWAGDISFKLSPLMAGYEDDDDYYPLEPLWFSRKVADLKMQLGLKDHNLPLTGLEGKSTLKIFDSYPVGLTSMIARLGMINNFFDQDSSTQTLLYVEPWVYVGRAEGDASPLLHWGSSFISSWDASDTGPDILLPVNAFDLTRPMAVSRKDEWILSGDLKLKLGQAVEITHEAALSTLNMDVNQTSPNVYPEGLLIDNAMTTAVSIFPSPGTITASYSSVGPEYYNFFAQSRIYDAGINESSLGLVDVNGNSFLPDVPIFSQNQVYRPDYSYDNMPTTFPGYPHYDRRTWTGYDYYNVLMNNTFPYGPATPNRQGMTCQWQGGYFGGFFNPYVRMDNYQEIWATEGPSLNQLTQRHFWVQTDGLSLDLTKSKEKYPIPLPVILTGGWKQEYTTDGLPGDVDLRTITWSGEINYGLSFLYEGLKLLAAYKTINGYGREYTLTYPGGLPGAGALSRYDIVGPQGLFNSLGYGLTHQYLYLNNYDAREEIFGLGFVCNVLNSDHSILALGWQMDKYEDQATMLNDYSAEEYNIKWSITF